jgi:WhiB family redox-sensing transcriptional regulator
VNWYEYAACKGKGDLFFAPPRERPPAKVIRVAQAHAICSVCPVRQECREEAKINDEFGIWGGLAEDEYAKA